MSHGDSGLQSTGFGRSAQGRSRWRRTTSWPIWFVRNRRKLAASESLLTLKISKDMFYRLVTEFPSMAIEMMRELAHRVEDTNQKLREATANKAA